MHSTIMYSYSNPKLKSTELIFVLNVSDEESSIEYQPFYGQSVSIKMKM